LNKAVREKSVFWIRIDLTRVPEPRKAATYTSSVWDLARNSNGDAYEQARYRGQSLGLISDPPGFIAQIDWATCRNCGRTDLTVRALCYNCAKTAEGAQSR
jgi:hypothetical protein